jgi:Flp pilus assembly protein TadG
MKTPSRFSAEPIPSDHIEPPRQRACSTLLCGPVVSPRGRKRLRQAQSRRGAATVLGIFLTGVMVVLLGMALDLGYVHVSQAELQRSSDAAALAACWELFDHTVAGSSNAELQAAVVETADVYSSQNRVASTGPRVSLTGQAVVTGRYDHTTNQFFGTSGSDINAVRVEVSRSQQSNGEVPLFFSRVLGRDSQAMTSASTAALIQSVRGFSMPAGDDQTLDLLPFALDSDTWEAICAGQGPDNFTFRDGRVTAGSNGAKECNLYPQGTGSPGNRGTVDIGSSNNSTKDISRQILHGISRQDLVALNKELVFDSQGKLSLNGDTGISAGVKDELQAIVGQKRIIPIFSQVQGNGNNATYTIVKFAGVRILAVKLTGKMSDKHLTVEPVPMIARHAVIDTEQTYQNSYVYSPVVLVQ